MLGNAVDAGVVVAYFALTLFLGLSVSRIRGKSNLREYALANRELPGWAVLGSIIAAETSAATFLGAPAESYKSGSFVYCQLALGMIVARILVARIFIRVYYAHNVESIYEFLATRFGPLTKNAASSLFIFGRLLGIGVRLYLGGVIFVVIWRYSWGGEPDLLEYGLGIVAILLMTSLYTTLGGIKAVVYTDALQTLFMFLGAVCAAVFLFAKLPNGWETLRAQLNDFQGVHFLSLGTGAPIFHDPYTIFAALIGMTCLTMATHGTDQDMVQRMLTAKSQRESRWALITSGLVDLPIALLFSAIGILLLVHYGVSPDPSLPKPLNEVFAYYIVTSLPVGIRGLVIAGVFSTLMGSTSAAMNSLAVSVTKDWYLPYFKPGATSAELMSFAKRATVGCAILLGLIAIGTAAVVRANPSLTIIPIALGVLGMTYGSLLGVFLLGALTKTRGRDGANVVAMALGITAVVVAGQWGGVAWPWYAPIGLIVTLGVAMSFTEVRCPPRLPESEV